MHVLYTFEWNVCQLKQTRDSKREEKQGQGTKFDTKFDRMKWKIKRKKTKFLCASLLL